MISYSWEKGVSETAHGVARALTKSGIGCWIDVMKLGVSDDTAQITRTVAAHARFVVIFLTDKYISSPACFIEFLEAVNAPGAKERVIVYLPSRHNVSERVLRLSAQLEKKGILILTDEHELIVCLNDVIIHSNHDSHLYWWQNYVGTVAGIPFDAITPSRTQAGRLKRYTFFGWTPWKAVSISNIWLDSSLRKMGTNGASFPVAGGIGLLSFLLTILMMSVVLRDSMAILSVLLYQTYNVDYGMPRIESPVATNILFVNLALQGLVLILLVFIMSLSDSFDNRYRMHQSLRPLLASFNIRQQLDVDTSSKKKTTNDAFRRMLGTYNALSSLPKIKVLIYDFGTNNQVAKTLHDFLSHLDLTPSELVDFEQDDFGTGLFEVFVPVFVFGSPTGRPLEVASQVTKFGEILRRCGLRMQDCVLIAADPQEKREVVGLFDCTFMLHGREVLMSKFLILVESFYQSHEFASEVIFHIGLRVKGALERITQQSVQNVAARNEQHIESFREQTKPLHQANSASRNYGSYVPLDSA
ncbi:hypothetical protein BC830DRAFT_1094101 [Chytriomyces sp. MP71]|nr:hypothetical protein BC830DRAFT_1094101 [Chytriomyces sp. MP71]